MAIIDSEAAFRSRALQLGLTEAHLDALKADGIDSFSKYAFCTTYNPQQPDDKVLFDYLEQKLGERPVGGVAACYRRLMFEAHTLALAELKSKVEQTSESDAKSIPAAERLARLDEQKKRLSGILWSDEVEPSHWLVDQTVHQMENQIVKYIHPNKCSSRRHEAGAQKTEQTFVLDSSGKLEELS